MRINTKCSSAVHVLLMIALMPPACKITSELLASSVGSNPVEIRRLLIDLKKAGIISVARGPGGATLLKAPRDITLLDIYNAVDPKSLDDLIGVHSHPEPRCLFGRNISALLSEPYAEIGETVRRKMDAITLERLCTRLKEIEPALCETESKPEA